MVACPLPISVCCINRYVNIGSAFRYNVSVKVFQLNVCIVKQGSFCNVERNFIKMFIGYQILATFDVYLTYCHAINRCSDNDFLLLFSEDYLFGSVGNFIPNFYFSGWKFHFFKCFKVCSFSLSYIDLCRFLNIGFCVLVGFKHTLGSHQILTGFFHWCHFYFLHNFTFLIGFTNSVQPSSLCALGFLITLQRYDVLMRWIGKEKLYVWVSFLPAIYL